MKPGVTTQLFAATSQKNCPDAFLQHYRDYFFEGKKCILWKINLFFVLQLFLFFRNFFFLILLKSPFLLLSLSHFQSWHFHLISFLSFSSNKTFILFFLETLFFVTRYSQCSQFLKIWNCNKVKILIYYLTHIFVFNSIFILSILLSKSMYVSTVRTVNSFALQKCRKQQQTVVQGR